MLPGGFKLPITIVKEIVQDYEMACCKSELSDDLFIETYCDQYLITQMISGQIISKETSINDDGNVRTFNGCYICEEMIGREKIEQIIQGD